MRTQLRTKVLHSQNSSSKGPQTKKQTSTQIRKKLVLPLLLFSLIWGLPLASAWGLINDSKITISSATDVTNKRQALIQFIWGSAGFPRNKLPSLITPNVCRLPAGSQLPAKDVCDFAPNLSNLARVDEI